MAERLSAIVTARGPGRPPCRRRLLHLLLHQLPAHVALSGAV